MICRLHGPRRRGATITELVVSMIVLSVAITSLAQLVSLSAQQRRVGEARRLALAELANQAERVAAMSWDETAPDKLTAWEPSADFAAAALSPVCKAQVTEEAGPPASRRIRLEVAWTPPGREPVTPVSLTVWKFAAGGEP